ISLSLRSTIPISLSLASQSTISISILHSLLNRVQILIASIILSYICRKLYILHTIIGLQITANYRRATLIMPNTVNFKRCY
ncbi:hypothetical protein RDABS01_017591, partial [Bienertia sinuspersici]